MYINPAFEVTDNALLLEFIGHFPLGLLITNGPHRISANLYPFIVAGTPAATVLQAHIARANPQWSELSENSPTLVVFQGTNHYITPNWYPSKAPGGRVVPTWNYSSVQAQGRVTLHHDATWLREHLAALTAANERALIQTMAEQGEPASFSEWKITDAPKDFVDRQIGFIVGIEICDLQLSGKFKLSQNRSTVDRAGVRNGLASLGAKAAPTLQAMQMIEDGLNSGRKKEK